MIFPIFIASLLLLRVSAQDESGIIEADTAWIIVASCLVMIMTPGLAFFYGGLVKQRSFVSILGQCLIIFSIVTALWAFIGYSLAFGDSKSQFLGGMDNFSLRNVDYKPSIYAATIPSLLFYFYQNKFATITPCLFIGATAERVRFSSVVILSSLWLIVVYCPIAHWNWNVNGFLKTLGVHDFAGGNVVHLSSGSAALVAAMLTDWIQKREKEKRMIEKNIGSGLRKHKSMAKHGRQVQEANDTEQLQNAKESTAFVVLGTGLLWFGWFGFNSGSALSANWISILALINTNIAASAALLTWHILELLGGKKASVIGMCVGAVCGLVGITPACGYVPIYASGIIGAIASLCTFGFYKLMDNVPYKPDDRLGVFGCHGISGIVGSILIGFFADKEQGAAMDGIFRNGGGHLLGVQIAGVCCSFLWSSVVTSILVLFLYAVGLYKVIDEEYENEGDEFDEQAVFIPNFEKILSKLKGQNVEIKKIESGVEFGMLNQNSEKIETNVQLVFDEKKDEKGSSGLK